MRTDGRSGWWGVWCGVVGWKGVEQEFEAFWNKDWTVALKGPAEPVPVAMAPSPPDSEA